jgi:hypothetical protein
MIGSIGSIDGVTSPNPYACDFWHRWAVARLAIEARSSGRRIGRLGVVGLISAMLPAMSMGRRMPGRRGGLP